jgi:hypothetical protein
VADRGADVSIGRPALDLWSACRNFLIDTAPIRITPNSHILSTNQVSNRHETGDFCALIFTNHQPLFTTHRVPNRNCLELEIAVTPSLSSKIEFLIATARGGKPNCAITTGLGTGEAFAGALLVATRRTYDRTEAGASRIRSGTWAITALLANLFNDLIRLQAKLHANCPRLVVGFRWIFGAEFGSIPAIKGAALRRRREISEVNGNA